MITISNINGTSDNTCKCGSWLEHWKKFSGQAVPSFCPVEGCLGQSLLGAHVQKDSSYDRNWYIVPLCTKCNTMTGKSLKYNDVYKLVSANVSETCGRVTVAVRYR
jgi:hypothetical protein